MGKFHKKFTDGQVKNLFERYENKEIARKDVQQILKITKSRFFDVWGESDLGDAVCIFGGPSGPTMNLGSPDELKGCCKLIEIVGKDGGLNYYNRQSSMGKENA